MDAQNQNPASGNDTDARRLFYDYVTGRIVFLWLRLRFRAVLKEIEPFSLYLEREVFHALKKRNMTKLFLVVTSPGGPLVLSAESSDFEFPSYQAERFSRYLTASGIGRIELDTTLESGQIVEAMLLFLYVHSVLDRADPSAVEYERWNRRRIASALLGAAGYKKFCAQIRLDRDAGVLDVAYSYCPLPLSRVTQRLTGFSAYADHRTLFRLAPRASVVAFLSIVLPAAAAAWNPAFSSVVTGIVAVGFAAGVGIGIRTIGAIQYDKENYEKIKAAHLERITHLSRFPAVNPQPVIEIGADGSIVYLNPSAKQFLRTIGRDPADAPAMLPDNVDDLARSSLQAPNYAAEVEHSVSGRVLHYWFSVFPEDMTVIASAADITHLKHVENELRLLNERLESRVLERTEEIAQTQDAAILCLAGLAETRDLETGRHLERTRHYVLKLCEGLTSHTNFRSVLTEENIRLAFKSAPLHDIGKVGVPDAILLKPGKLSDEEFELIKKHPVYGGDALAIAESRLGFNSFLSMAKDIAYYHHERWDGTGYPFGISGIEIPWAARLMAVADLYDALTSKRPYKEPWSHDDACAEIRRGRGTRFDPDVVDAFIRAEEHFKEIAGILADDESSGNSNRDAQPILAQQGEPRPDSAPHPST